MTHQDNTSVKIPNHRWVAQEARWIFKDEKEAWVRGLVKTNSGDLLISVYRGGLDQSNGEEILYRSRDQGLTWSEETNFTRQFDLQQHTAVWQTLRSGRILGVIQRVPIGEFRDTGTTYSNGPPGRKPHPVRVYEYTKKHADKRKRALF